MSVIKEFRDFAMRGNVIDLAVGVIIGGAFGKIVDSVVKDLIMPLVNFLVGGRVDFSNKFIVLRAPADYTGPQTYDALSKAGATLLGFSGERGASGLRPGVHAQRRGPKCLSRSPRDDVGEHLRKQPSSHPGRQ